MVKYGPAPPMARTPVQCPSPGYPYITPDGLPDYTQVTDHLSLHSRLAHPVVAGAAAARVPQAGAGQQQAGKVDKKVRPSATLGMFELQWIFYLSEWARYVRQTGINDQVRRDELWNTMDTELRELAFSEGG